MIGGASKLVRNHILKAQGSRIWGSTAKGNKQVQSQWDAATMLNRASLFDEKVLSGFPFAIHKVAVWLHLTTLANSELDHAKGNAAKSWQKENEWGQHQWTSIFWHGVSFRDATIAWVARITFMTWPISLQSWMNRRCLCQRRFRFRMVSKPLISLAKVSNNSVSWPTGATSEASSDRKYRYNVKKNGEAWTCLNLIESKNWFRRGPLGN